MADVYTKEHTLNLWNSVLNKRVKISDLNYDTILYMWNSLHNNFTLFNFIRKYYYPKFAGDDKIFEFIDYFLTNKNTPIYSLIEALEREHQCNNVVSFDGYLESCILGLLTEVNDDKLKMIAYKKCKSQILKNALVVSIEDDDIKEALACDITDTKLLGSIALTCTSDKVRLTFISLIDDISIKKQIVVLLKDDDNKLGVLNLFSLKDKVDIIRSLKSDEKKVDFMLKNKLSRDDQKKIIISLKSTTFKNILLNSMYTIREKGAYEPSYKLKSDIYDAKEDVPPKKLTFGIEIEAVGKMAEIIRECGGHLLGSWTIKNDYSLNNGVEFTSGILRYTEKHLNEIYKVCNFANKNNLEVDESCALHIHIGSDYLDTIDAWFWLYYIFSSCERIFYLISNEPFSALRENISSFAAPISKDFAEFFNESEDYKDLPSFIKALQFKFLTRYESINVANIGKRFDTVEFRIPNGTLNPDDIVADMLLFGNLMKLAKKLSYLPMEKPLYDIVKAFDGDETTEEERFELLMKLLFKDEQNREVFRKRYSSNSLIYDKNLYKSLEKEMEKRIHLDNGKTVI